MAEILAKDGTPLDASIVTLAKAIRKAEGGDYNNTTGDAGTSKGAYQFNGKNFETWAKQYKLDPNDFSPENQDKVAYHRLADFKAKKYTPEQSAAAWNAGEGRVNDWQNHVGDTVINGKTIHYDTPGYVKKVMGEYNTAAQAAKQASSTPLVQPTNPAPVKQGGGFWDIIKKGFSIGPFGAPGNIGQVQSIGGLAAGASLLDKGRPVIGPLAGAAITDVTGNPALGAGVSAAISGSGKKPSTGEVIPNETSTLAETLASQNDVVQSNKNADAIVRGITDSLNTTIGGRKLLDDPNSHEGIQTLANFGLGPKIDSNGVQDWNGAIDKSDKMVGDLSKKMEKALAAEDSQGSIIDAATKAKEEAHGRVPEPEWESADKTIDELARAYGKGGYIVGLDRMQRIKQETGRGVKWNILDSSTKREAYKAFSRAARDQIIQHTKSPELYNAAMKMEQRLITGQKVARKLHQTRALKNESMMKGLMHSGGRYAAIYIGDKIGGPLGAILGSMVGEKIHHSTDTRFGKTIFETPAMKTAMAMLGSEQPKAYNMLKTELEKRGIAVPPEEKQEGILPQLLKEKNAPKVFTEGTKIDTTVEKLHGLLSHGATRAQSSKANNSQRQSKGPSPGKRQAG